MLAFGVYELRGLSLDMSDRSGGFQFSVYNEE